MNRSNLWVVVSLTIALVSLAVEASADDDDRRRPKAPRNAVVDFGQPQPQPAPAPAPVGAAATHFLLPDDVTIREGGTVTFIVNSGGHGIAIYPVSRNTTRDDIALDLCQGNEGVDEANRADRATVCNGTIVDGSTGITGTQNLNYVIRDGRGNRIIVTGTNDARDTNLCNRFQRIDDSTRRLLATSGQLEIEVDGLCSVVLGTFLDGTRSPSTLPTADLTPGGNHIEFRFTKAGRYLIICMNRGHYLNDHMFGFVDVVDGDDDGRGGDDRDDNNGHGGHN
jgi:hypothetical protein